MQVAPFAVVVTNLVVAASLSAGATVSPRMRAWSQSGLAIAGVLLAVLSLVDALLLGFFVFGEDSYRDNGTSRWDAYQSPGGALGPMFVLSLVLLGAAAALLAVAGLRGWPRLLGAMALATSLVCVFLVTATVIGFSAN